MKGKVVGEVRQTDRHSHFRGEIAHFLSEVSQASTTCSFDSIMMKMKAVRL